MRTNLPVQLTNFVGRRQQMVELRRLLAEARLVTVAGGSGMGKTRLAIEVARGMLDQLGGGVWFVSLASLSEPALIPNLVAEALGARDQQGESALTALQAHLGEEPALLVLDNCEHLLDSSARLAEELLRACPGLRVLATSQEPLRVPGEAVWRIPPLAVPGDEGRGARAGDFESVQLFAARAALVKPGFVLDDHGAATAAQICRRLDGIPLAIELAAARTEMMSLTDILERLEDRFRLLTGGMRTALPRHQTLRAALDWGHLLLEDPQRRLFRRLSVFVGSFEAAAAESVCSGPDLNADEVLGHLLRLADKSFVWPEPSPAGSTRYRVLETVRQYGAERLLESGEADRVRSRHADHFIALAEEIDRLQQHSPAETAWLARLEADHDNVRAALEWCRAHDAGRWLRLATAMGWFWVTRGHLAEGREWLEGALAMTSLDPGLRARGLLWAARLAFWQGDYEAALVACGQSLGLYRELGDDREAGWPLNLMGSTYMYQGRFAEAQSVLEEVLAGRPSHEVRLEAMMALGELHLQQGRLAEARRLLEESRAAAAGPIGRVRVAPAELLLGIVGFFEGDLVRARTHLGASLEVFREMKNLYALAAVLELCAGLATAEGQPERALRLCAAAAQIRSSTRARLPEHWRQVLERAVVGPAREAAGPRADAAWAEGRAMTLEEALAYAESSTEPTSEPRPRPRAGGLSRREKEVAMMVARGMTNRQIAERLVLAERTVEGHVERIRGKLGVRSRTQIAVWVVEQGGLTDAAELAP